MEDSLLGGSARSPARRLSSAAAGSNRSKSTATADTPRSPRLRNFWSARAVGRFLREWVRGQHADTIAAAARIALAQAPTERTAAILLDQFHGALRRAIEEIRQTIAMSKNAAREKIDALLAFAPLGRHSVAPWQVVIAGRPNVGKSSLINALVGYNRSIVHPSPGTTRDVVAVSTAIDGWPATLCDTAGLHGGGDAVECAGIALAAERIAEADLVLLVFDASVAWSAPDAALLAALPAALVVHNKIDAAVAADPARPAGLRASALCGDGLDLLLREIAARLVPHPPPPGAAVPFAAEHAAELTELRQIACRGTDAGGLEQPAATPR